MERATWIDLACFLPAYLLALSVAALMILLDLLLGWGAGAEPAD